MDPIEMQIVRPLTGGGDSAAVDLVRIDGRLLVLKHHTPRGAAAERRFHRRLAACGLPSLAVENNPGLRPDQILLEYVEDSPTIGGSPSPRLCQRWGAAISALHGVRSDNFEALDEGGELVPARWSDFLDDLVRTALEKQRGASDLPSGLVDEAERRLRTLSSFQPDAFSLTHGDLHLNNALIRGEGIVLFDKPAGVWVAPPILDICLIYSEAFPGARYGAARQGDDERLAAFLAGYGELPRGEKRRLDHFVLLRSLRRYPSPFVPELRTVIEVALERLSAA
jgi:Ser/Thr protein kinase RdoA (MazF antagonist)